MIDMALRPLLAWFNAVLIPGSIYLTKDDISHDGPSETTAANLDALAQALVAEAPRWAHRTRGARPRLRPRRTPGRHRRRHTPWSAP